MVASVEEMFYLAWPVFLVAGLRSAKYAAWGAVIISPIFRFIMNKQGFGWRALFAPPSVMDSLATGCLVAIYAEPLTRWVTKHRHWLGLVWVVAFLTPVIIVIGDNVRFIWPLPQITGHLAWTALTSA